MIQLSKTEKKKVSMHFSRRFTSLVYDIVGSLVIALSIFAILSTYFVRIVGVDGTSMLPTLNDGDLMVISVMDDKYHRGDIVVVDRYTYEPLIKRVIAVGGETISIDNEGHVFINGKQLREKYIQGKTVLRDFSGEVTIPLGYVFVMGDNRTLSKDSRMNEIGLISTKDIVGKVEFRIWPIQSIGQA